MRVGGIGGKIFLCGGVGNWDSMVGLYYHSWLVKYIDALIWPGLRAEAGYSVLALNPGLEG